MTIFFVLLIYFVSEVSYSLFGDDADLDGLDFELHCRVLIFVAPRHQEGRIELGVILAIEEKVAIKCAAEERGLEALLLQGRPAADDDIPAEGEAQILLRGPRDEGPLARHGRVDHEALEVAHPKERLYDLH